MAIPIEFFLNFSVNSDPISRAMGKMDGLLKTGAESLKSLKGRLEETMSAAGVIGEEMSSVYARIQTTTENIYGSGEAFSNLMQKNILSEFQSALGNIESIFGATLENFDMTKISSQLKDLKFQPGFKDSFDNFNENLSKYRDLSSRLKPSQMKPMVDLLETIEKAETAEDLANMNKELSKMIKNAEGVDALSNKFKSLGQSVKGFFNRYVSRIAGAVGAYTVLDDAAKAHTEAARSISRYAIGGFEGYGSAVDRVRGNIRAFNDETLRVAGQTSVSLTEASEAMSNLARMRVSQNIEELGQLAETTTLMSKAFNVSQGQAAEFARSLVQIGGVATSDVGKAADAMAKVQHQMGLTEAGAQATINQVSSLMRQMQLFGAQSSDVAKVTEEVARLASSFEMVGLSADGANRLLTQMMDPTQINDNILLWQGLGMSAQQGMAMMMGDASQMNNMTERMRDLAVDLKDQYGDNIFALQEMAKAHGLSLQEVQALSSLTDEQIAKDKEGANLQEAAAAARQGMMDQLQIVWAQINVILQTAVLPAMRLFSNILKPIVAAFQWINKDLGKGHGLLKAVQAALKVIVGLVAVGLLTGFLKNLKAIKAIGGAFGGLGKGLSAIVGKTGEWLGSLSKGKGLVGKISEGMSKLGGRGGRGGPFGVQDSGLKGPTSQIGGRASQIGANQQPEQVSKLGQAFKSFPKASQLLALAVAIIAIGAAVAGIVLSISVLAKVMKEFDLGQMIVFFIGVAAILIVVMWGMVAAIGALGAISAVAAGPLLAAAVAIFAIGAAVAIVILSFAVLANAVSNIIDSVVGLVGAFSNFFNMLLNSGKSFGEIVGVFGAIALGILMLGWAAGAAAIPLMLFAIAAGIAAIPLMMIAPALMTIAEAGQMMQGLASVFAAMSVGLLAMAPAMWAVGAASPLFMVAMATMAAGIPIMFLLGRASTRLAENMSQLGTGLQLIAENASIAMAGLANLMSFFQSDQIAAMEQFTEQFAQQMQKIAESIIQLQVSVMVAGVAGFIGGLLGKITGGAVGAEPADQDNQMGAVVEQLIESNEHLDEIKKNTAENIVLMKRLIASNRRVEMGIDFAR